jgi:cell division protein FtsB
MVDKVITKKTYYTIFNYVYHIKIKIGLIFTTRYGRKTKSIMRAIMKQKARFNHYKKTIVVSIAILIFGLLLTSCGVSQEQYDSVTSERDILKKELQDLKNNPLKGFDTVTEFKNWLNLHVQPETRYLEDGFLAAVRVQEEAIKEGYLVGINVDILDWIEGNESVIGITTFVGNELYFWMVEDNELYYPLDLKK